jgi:MFS family permease
VAILAATLMTPMDVPLISPALPAVGSAFDIAASRAGLLVTVYALPGILLAPFVGALADRVGRRRVLSGCLAVFGAAGTAVALTPTFQVDLGLRLVQGIAAGSLLSALAMTAVVSTQNGRLAARASRRTLVVVGFGLYAAGFLGAAFGGSLPAVVAALLVFGAGGGLVTPTVFAAISAMAPDHVRAGVMTLQTTTIGLSQAVGPVLFTLAAGAVGYRATLLAASVAAALGTAVLPLVSLER